MMAVQTLSVPGPWPVTESDVEHRNSKPMDANIERRAERRESEKLERTMQLDNKAQLDRSVRPLFSSHPSAANHDTIAPAKNGASSEQNGASLKLSTEQGFVAGSENELAAEACLTLTEFLGTNYNPLLITGMPGTGKSHIARGLAKVWQRKLNSPTVAIVFSGAEFVTAFQAANNQERQREFQNRVRRAKMLVIDELTQMAGKTAALHELKATIDELLANGGHIIITSRLAIEMIPGVNAALQARLLGGLTISLKIPGPEARFILWERYVAAQGITASDEVLRSLAAALEITAADIWQTVTTLAEESENGREITQREVKSVLKQQRGAYQPTVRTIANLCAKYYGLKPTELSSPLRRRTIVAARNMAIYLARTMSEISLEQIGKHFGGRDHTTVLHGIRTIEDRLKTEPETKQAYEDLRKMLAQR
jgi:chromosomal replication initiator protein